MTNQAFNGIEGVFRVGYGLAFGRLAHQHFAVVGIGDDGRGGAGALGVLNDPGFVAVHDGDARVGGS